MQPILTSSLVVTAAASGSVVWYTIHPSARDQEQLKTIRFSELDKMHKQMSKEVPSFTGRLPPKTLKKNTKPHFIETRRKAIEMYLRLASTDEMARASGAWHQFLVHTSFVDLRSDSERASDDCIETTIKESISQSLLGEDSSMHKNVTVIDSEGEPESFSSTANVEVRALLQSKRNNLIVAEERKESLEGELNTILHSVLSAQTEAKDKAGLESDAAARLRAHRESLAELDMQLSLKCMVSTSTEQHQREMAKRLLEELQIELQTAAVSKNRAQKGLEVASKAVGEATSKALARVADASAAKAEAEGTFAGAQEGHAAMQVAMSVLEIRAKARLDDLNIAERELANSKLAIKVLDAGIKDAEDLRQKAEVATKNPDGSVASHIEESACRTRAHKLAIARATECVTNSANLRDMRTRGLLMGIDRISLKLSENASNVAAEAAAEALAKATQAADETEATDECQLAALQVIAAVAHKKLRKRETLVAAFAARSIVNNKVAVEDASLKMAAAVAANNAVQQRFAALRQQVETSAQALPECSAKLAEATTALATVTKENESDMLPFRQAEIVESQVLKERQAEEAALVKKVGEAQIAAAEAAAAFETSMEGGPAVAEANRIYQLVQSTEARSGDLDKAAQVAAHAHKASVEAVEVVKSTLAALDSDSSDDQNDEDDNDDSDSGKSGKAQKHGKEQKEFDAADAAKRQRKRVDLWSKQGKSAKTKEKESKIKALEKVMQDRKNVAEVAAVAAKAAHDELDALRAQQKVTFCPTEALIKREMDLVDSGLASRKENGVAIVAAVQLQVVAWMVEQATLRADLHRAQLLAAAAEGDVTYSKDLAKSLAEPEKVSCGAEARTSCASLSNVEGLVGY